MKVKMMEDISPKTNKPPTTISNIPHQGIINYFILSNSSITALSLLQFSLTLSSPA